MRRLRRAHEKHVKASKLFTRRVVAAGAAAAISIAASGLAKSEIPIGDKHQMIVGADADGDLLADGEEYAIGYQPFTADQNRNTFRDGVELAVRCTDAISRLPLEADVTDPGQIYKKEMLMFGLEQCEVCGETVNMGAVRIVNPRLGLSVELPVIGVHTMAHGSFGYAGDLHRGRANVPLLLRTLEVRFPCEPDEHQLPLDYSTETAGQIAPDANDLDGDMLADGEELSAGLNLHNADQNENLLPDGIELAQRFAEIIDRLPTFEPGSPDGKGVYRINYMLRGLEWCEICGESVNMGYWQIVNSTLGLSMDVPVIAWHYMQHGSFSFLGDVHGAGRLDVAALKQILDFPTQCGDIGIPRPPADLNGDCRVDFEDLAALADRWLDSADPAAEQPTQK